MNTSLNPSGITVYIMETILKYIYVVELSTFIMLHNETCYLPLPYSSFHNSASCWFSNSFYIFAIVNCKLKRYAYCYHRNKNTITL